MLIGWSFFGLSSIRIVYRIIRITRRRVIYYDKLSHPFNTYCTAVPSFPLVFPFNNEFIQILIFETFDDYCCRYSLYSETTAVIHSTCIYNIICCRTSIMRNMCRYTNLTFFKPPKPPCCTVLWIIVEQILLFFFLKIRGHSTIRPRRSVDKKKRNS
jgi:hypothetical protein